MHLNSTELITETVLKTHIGTVSFFQDKILGSLSCVSERMSSNPDVSPIFFLVKSPLNFYKQLDVEFVH